MTMTTKCKCPYSCITKPALTTCFLHIIPCGRPVRLHHIFPYYLITTQFSGKDVMNTQWVQIYSRTFTQYISHTENSARHYHDLCGVIKYQIFSLGNDFLDISKNHLIPSFINNPSCGSRFFRQGRKDGRIKVAFLNFANPPKTEYYLHYT